MAKCKKCGREIADGKKYCVPCDEMRDHKAKWWVKLVGGIVAALSGICMGVYKVQKANKEAQGKPV